MKNFAKSLLVALVAGPVLFAQSQNVDQRLKSATDVITQMTGASDKGIPEDLLGRASCVVVVPNLKKGGFIVGAEYGAGFFSCRKNSGVGWSAPGCVKITGGKFGLLIGGAETDVVMLVMNKSGMEHLLSNKTTIGGEASAAAGPLGRDASARTDAMMHAEILTYSRQRGIYGGLDLSGAALTQDEKANADLYGHDLTNQVIVEGNTHTPAAALPFTRALTRVSSRK